MQIANNFLNSTWGGPQVSQYMCYYMSYTTVSWHKQAIQPPTITLVKAKLYFKCRFLELGNAFTAWSISTLNPDLHFMTQACVLKVWNKMIRETSKLRLKKRSDVEIRKSAPRS